MGAVFVASFQPIDVVVEYLSDSAAFEKSLDLLRSLKTFGFVRQDIPMSLDTAVPIGSPLLGDAPPTRLICY